MEIWKPPKDRPHLWEWWVPLLAFARRARADRVAWLVTIEDFELIGRFDRPPRPSVWIYRHRQNGGQVGVDSGGQAYRFIAHRSGASPGRLWEMPIRAAVWAAGLPDFAPAVKYLDDGDGHSIGLWGAPASGDHDPDQCFDTAPYAFDPDDEENDDGLDPDHPDPCSSPARRSLPARVGRGGSPTGPARRPRRGPSSHLDRSSRHLSLVDGSAAS